LSPDRYSGGEGGAVGTKGGKATAKTLHRVFESAKVGPWKSFAGFPLTQGATRIKMGLPFICPAGMELGGALRNTEFPLNWYLSTFLSLAILTEILRLRLRMTMRAGR